MSAALADVIPGRAKRDPTTQWERLRPAPGLGPRVKPEGDSGEVVA
jgi:hypothetical protein